GLKLAIFNSCDGLGLAKELGDLNIPQTIVMRENVPDIIAHEFLKNFLKSFAAGESLHLAVRYARLQLQGLEDNFPRSFLVTGNLPKSSGNNTDLGRITW
ncbi:MAG: CHAT domain-containing protein, partial [Cyanobacteria bacterium J06639_18]